MSSQIATFATIFFSMIPVSYTHLDVYKRQVQGGNYNSEL